MRLRFIITLLCLAGIAGYLSREQQTGNLAFLEARYLDFLIANSRESFEVTKSEGKVVLIELREEDRSEFASWPPPPLDWQTLIKGIQPYEPEVLVITTPLHWGRPTPEFVPALADALRPFPSVILGVESLLADQALNEPAFLGDLEAALPRVSQVQGDMSLTPSLMTLITAPDPSLRGTCELGLLSLRQVDGQWRIPYAVRDRDTLIPTLLAQTLSRHSHSPYTTGQRLRLGTGAGAHLQNGLFLPLTPSGEYTVSDEDPVSTVNALDLMAGELADLTSETDKELLRKASVLVIGITGTTPADRATPLYARALNRALSIPRLTKLSVTEQAVTWGIAALIALWMVLGVSRSAALKVGAAILFVVALLSLLLFQSQRIWYPPAIPMTLLLAGSILGRYLPASNTDVKAAPDPEKPTVA